MTLPEIHRAETLERIQKVDKTEIASWLLSEGYYPEQYVLPPCFTVNNFELREERYCQHNSF